MSAEWCVEPIEGRITAEEMQCSVCRQTLGVFYFDVNTFNPRILLYRIHLTT